MKPRAVLLSDSRSKNQNKMLDFHFALLVVSCLHVPLSLLSFPPSLSFSWPAPFSCSFSSDSKPNGLPGTLFRFGSPYGALLVLALLQRTSSLNDSHREKKRRNTNPPLLVKRLEWRRTHVTVTARKARHHHVALY